MFFLKLFLIIIMAAVLALPVKALGMEGRLYRYRSSPGSLQAFESPAVHGFKVSTRVRTKARRRPASLLV